MTYNKNLIASDTTKTVEESLLEDYLKINMYDLSVSCFLEDSARYLGTFYEQDPYHEKDEKYLIN